MISRLSNFVGPLGSFFSNRIVGEYFGSLVFNNTNQSLILSDSTDYIIGTNDFTIESWFKVNNFTGYGGIICTRLLSNQYGISLNITPSASPSGCDVEFYVGGDQQSLLNTVEINIDIWYHVAFSRIGGTLSWYFNGDKQNSITDLNDYSQQVIVVGRYYSDFDNYYFDGLISGPRLIIGEGIYNDSFTPSPTYSSVTNTKFLINFGSETNIIDNSDFNHEITIQSVGFTSILPHFGGSYRFGLNNTTERWIQMSASNDWVIGTGDFSVEWFQYQTQASPPSYSRLFQIGDWPQHSLAVSIENGTFLLWLNAGNTFYVSQSLTNYLNQWVHFAISRNSGQVSVWINGTRVWFNTVSTNINNNTSPFKIGSGSDNVWNGYLTNFRLVTGQSAYTSGPTITVPTSPLTNVPGTKLLLLFGDPNQLNDSSPYNRSVTNFGATWSDISPFSE
jgi:hypothetical protein